jgi:hypothetical protein
MKRRYNYTNNTSLYCVNTADALGGALNSRPAIALGNWSYSIYLWHVPTHYAVMVVLAAIGHPVNKLEFVERQAPFADDDLGGIGNVRGQLSVFGSTDAPPDARRATLSGGTRSRAGPSTGTIG